MGYHVLYARPEQGFFYLERAGAELMLEQWSDHSWVHDGAGRDHAQARVGHGVAMQIATAALRDLHAHCLAKGALIFRPFEEVWYRAGEDYAGQAQFVIADPDGHLLRFAEGLGRSRQPPAEAWIVG